MVDEQFIYFFGKEQKKKRFHLLNIKSQSSTFFKELTNSRLHTVGTQLAHSWHTVGIQLAHSFHTACTQLSSSGSNMKRKVKTGP